MDLKEGVTMLDFLQNMKKINLNQNLFVEGIVTGQLLQHYNTKELKEKTTKIHSKKKIYIYIT